MINNVMLCNFFKLDVNCTINVCIICSINIVIMIKKISVTVILRTYTYSNSLSISKEHENLYIFTKDASKYFIHSTHEY